MQKIISFCWFLLCCSPFLQGQTIKYVKADATGLNNGQSWQDAFANLKHALSAANYGDTLWVAQGVYIPYSVNNSRDSSFILKSGVSIYGGFSGSETALSQRNMAQYPTILSGDIGVPGDSTDNVYNVLLGRDVDTTTVLDGLVVEYGYANNPNSPKLNYARGAGLFLRPANNTLTAAPKVRHCLFRNNYAERGGLAIQSYSLSGSIANVKIENCHFLQNYGAGACVQYSQLKGDIWVSDCVFSKNTNGEVVVSYFGGDTEIYIIRDTFDANITTHGFYIECSDLKPIRVQVAQSVFNNSFRCRAVTANSVSSSVFRLEDCVFLNHKELEIQSDVFGFYSTNCKITNNALVIYILGENNRFVQRGNLIKDNQDIVYSTRGDLVSENNIFQGGKIYIDRYTGTEYDRHNFTNCIFNKNSLNIADSDWAVSIVSISTQFNYCTFIENTPLLDTIPMFFLHEGDSLTFNSCVFAIPPGNAPFIANRTSPDQHISVTNSVFSVSDCMDISAELGAEICANNQTGAMIQFMDTLNADFRLLPCSPGINAGDMSFVNALGLTTDLAGAPRVANGLPDAGALETVVDQPVVSLQTVSCAEKNDGAIGYTSLDCNVWNYTWTSSNGATGTLLDNLAAGEYYITLSNGVNGLLWTDTVQLTAPPVSWTTDFALTPASSVIATDGAIAALVTGSGTFTYLWSNGATTAQINQLAASTYTVTITNGDGCSAVYSQILGISATGETALPVVHLSPNPVRAGEHLQLPEIGWTSLELHDATGRRVWNVQNGGNKVVLPASIPEGLYRVLLYGRNGGIGYATVVVVR